MMFGGNPLTKIEKYTQKQKSGKIAGYLKSKDQAVRIAAIKALGQCDDELSYNTLTSLITVGSTDERVAVMESLGQLGKDQSFSLISHYVGAEADPRVKQAMNDALAAIRTRYPHGA